MIQYVYDSSEGAVYYEVEAPVDMYDTTKVTARCDTLRDAFLVDRALAEYQEYVIGLQDFCTAGPGDQNEWSQRRIDALSELFGAPLGLTPYPRIDR